MERRAGETVAQMSGPREFECEDCGTHVYTFLERRPGTTDNLCAECDFLRTVEDPVVRDQLRELLGATKQIKEEPK